MPIDISTEATTISITRKGIKTKNPISKALLNSLIIKAGIKVLRGMSEGFSNNPSPEAS